METTGRVQTNLADWRRGLHTVDRNRQNRTNVIWINATNCHRGTSIRVSKNTVPFGQETAGRTAEASAPQRQRTTSRDEADADKLNT